MLLAWLPPQRSSLAGIARAAASCPALGAALWRCPLPRTDRGGESAEERATAGDSWSRLASCRFTPARLMLVSADVRPHLCVATSPCDSRARAASTATARIHIPLQHTTVPYSTSSHAWPAHPPLVAHPAAATRLPRGLERPPSKGCACQRRRRSSRHPSLSRSLGH